MLGKNKKYGVDGGQVESLLNVLTSGNSVHDGKEIVRGFYSGEWEVEWSDDGESAVIRRAIRSLFDQHGVRITKGLKAASCPPNRSFKIERIEFSAIDFAERLGRFNGLGISPKISVAEFQVRASELVALIQSDEKFAGILNGPHFPIVIPATKITDLGQTMEQFVEAAGQAYLRQFPGRQFTNYRQGDLSGQVKVVNGSRYEQLQDRLSHDVVALWFPTALHGLSVHAQREQMNSLPEGCILSGPIDAAVGWMMYPDIVARDFQTPGYDCSAVSWQSDDYSLCFKASDDGARFRGRTRLGSAYDDYAGGLLFLR